MDVVDYLKKPFSFDRFYKAVQKAQELYLSRHSSKTERVIQADIKDNGNFIFVKADSKMVKVDFDQILFIEALGDYVKIHTSQNTITTYQSMKGVEEMLPPDKFPRVHKSYIVALNRIDVIDGNTIKIKTLEIPIGKNYRKDFFELINTRNLY